MSFRKFLPLIIACWCNMPTLTYAQTPTPSRDLRIGLIASLTGIAASYGGAVRDGAALAAEELNRQGTPIKLVVEDDQSTSLQTVTAYQKLKNVDNIDILVGGTWWANAIVKTTEAAQLPFLSCETLYNHDYIYAPNYFSLAGDLRDWVRVFEPLVKNRGFKTAATVRFASGFGATMAEEMSALFSEAGRRYLATLEYADVEMREAGTLAMRVKALAPEVVYVDSQPASFAAFVRRAEELGLSGLTFLGTSVVGDALRLGLLDAAVRRNEIYFTDRATFRPEFEAKFSKRYGRAPVLQADLGYYAVYLAAAAGADHAAALARLRSGAIEVGGLRFAFDEHNVFRGTQQELWSVREGRAVRKR